MSTHLQTKVDRHKPSLKATPQFKNAFVSVSDRTGLAEFLHLISTSDLRIVSTGGTARYLRENGFSVVDVSEQTGFREVMDGRVKTLHPRIHMSLLARNGHPSDEAVLKSEGLEPFDLVIGNLYPFESTYFKFDFNSQNHDFQELVEKIDVGGPSFLRAAAKSFERITCLVDPSDYSLVAMSRNTMELRRNLAAKVFLHLSAYDSLVGQVLGDQLKTSFLDKDTQETNVAIKEFGWGGVCHQELRYGENPQQMGFWYQRKGARTGWHQAQVLQGKSLSYNNLLDLQAAVETLREFESPGCVVVKHNNPCGVALGESISEALRRSLSADPVSAFGGIVALNREVDLDCAKSLGDLFLECVVAPSFDEESQKILSVRKNLRLLAWNDLLKRDELTSLKTISGGFLVQTQDVVGDWDESWKIFGEPPSLEIRRDLLFAWRVCAHLKSNAIAIARDTQTLGLGMGQVNRVDAVRQAIDRMKQHHSQTGNTVLASDAFFPFPDSVEIAAQSGIRWVIQPGGSKNDSSVLARAKELDVNLILTGKRHFKH